MNGTDLAQVKRIPPADGDTALAPAALGPRELYRQATDVAGVCGEIVKRTAKRIGNRNHVAVEGWQAIATTHGCMLSVKSVHEDEAGNVTAVAAVRRMSDGVELSEAEGFVGMDERTWAGRQRYARRAMAQTRAMSRVARAAFAHVVLLIDADLATTPAEEMGSDDEPTPRPQPRRAPPPTMTPAAFEKAWLSAVTAREFSEKTAFAFLHKWLDHRKVSLEVLDQTALSSLLKNAADGAYDSWLRGIESPGGPDADQGRANDGIPPVEASAQEPAPAPPSADAPPVDVVAEALAQDEYPMTLRDRLKDKLGISEDLATKAVTGWVRLNAPGGDARNMPADKRRSLWDGIEGGTASVSKTGVLRWE